MDVQARLAEAASRGDFSVPLSKAEHRDLIRDLVHEAVALPAGVFIECSGCLCLSYHLEITSDAELWKVAQQERLQMLRDTLRAIETEQLRRVFDHVFATIRASALPINFHAQIGRTDAYGDMQRDYMRYTTEFMQLKFFPREIKCKRERIAYQHQDGNVYMQWAYSFKVGAHP